jgi:hypothetical protein
MFVNGKSDITRFGSLQLKDRLPPKADIREPPTPNDRFRPLADIRLRTGEAAVAL